MRASNPAQPVGAGMLRCSGMQELSHGGEVILGFAEEQNPPVPQAGSPSPEVKYLQVKGFINFQVLSFLRSILIPTPISVPSPSPLFPAGEGCPGLAALMIQPSESCSLTAPAARVRGLHGTLSPE